MDIRSVIFDQIDSYNRYRPKVDSGVRAERAVKETQNVPKMSRKDIEDVVGKLNNTVHGMNERVTFAYHEKTDRVIVKVIDRDTNEVVREFPPREAIKLLEHLKDYIGMLVDESR